MKPTIFNILKELASNGGTTVRVNGDCMAAVMPNGSEITILRQSLYLPGDIVLVHRAGRLVSHRFLGYVPGRRGWCVITRADSAGRADGRISISEVIGRVSTVNSEVCRVSFDQRIRSAGHWIVAVLEIAGSIVTRSWVPSR